MTTQFKPELLSPAGSSQKYALMLLPMGQMLFMQANHVIAYVYATNEFNHANLKIGIDEAHALGKKILCSGEHCTA